MFCPRCGRNLNGDERFCPECGNVIQQDFETPPQSTYSQPERTTPQSTLLLYLAIGFVAMFVVTFVIGFYFLFFFIPVLFIGGGRSRSGMLFLGMMTGSLVGLMLRFLI